MVHQRAGALRLNDRCSEGDDRHQFDHLEGMGVIMAGRYIHGGVRDHRGQVHAANLSAPLRMAR